MCTRKNRLIPLVIFLVSAWIAGTAGFAGTVPFSCDYLSRTPVGTIVASSAPGLNEASGLVQSRRNPELFWSHQDNWDDDRLFALRRDGTYLGTWDLTTGPTRDTEDIAIGPGPIPGQPYIYLGDVGHNWGIWGCTTYLSTTGNCAGCPPNVDCRERNPRVFRALEPTLDPAQPFAAVTGYPAETITLKFPDAEMLGQRQDVETILVDPLSGDLYVVTKRSTPAMVFRAAYPQATNAPITMQWVADLPWGGDHQATGGDISPDGRLIIIRRYGDGYIWERPQGVTVGQAFSGTFCHRTDLGEAQGEAVAFDRDSSGTFYTTSEGSGLVPIYKYARATPSCITQGDCDDGLFCNGTEVCNPTTGCQSGTAPACAGEICDEALDRCAECVTNSDCAAGQTCDLPNGVCVVPNTPDCNLPTEVGALTVNKSNGLAEISWSDDGIPGPFRLYRGWLHAGTSWSYNHYCVGESIQDTAAEAPLAGPSYRLFYYLVTRVGCDESIPGWDSSGDSIPNSDPCPSEGTDADGDGVEQALDSCPSSYNPNQSDVDSDSHGDHCDNCTSVLNPYQENLDGDGLGNACDPDIDGDGRLNAIDNCPEHSNPGQEDADGDDAGDACDLS